MNISLKQFQHLVALNRYRHYGKAADALSISQPALSRSIQALEQNLGATLFSRSRGGVEPTETGGLLIEHARRIMAVTAELQSQLDEARDRARRKLAIACGHYPAELTVPGALSGLMREWPDLQITMEVTDWIRTVAALENDTCDLAVGDIGAESSLIDISRELLNDRQVYAVVRPGNPLSKMKRPDLQDLLAYPWACSPIPERAAKWFGPGPLAAGDLDAERGLFIPKIIASSLSTSLKLVMENDIVGIAPLGTALAHLQREELALVRFTAPWMRLNYGFMWNAQKPLSAVAQAFMNKIRTAEQELAGRESALREELGIARW
ncbi:MAG: LysR family transcriptional regulator [Xanthomonadales bacterium]|jgi:DNA-binding transcriptional LysR family regulator|nr:LysR family transcriptional regulator [Xanthomonadales bacterium]